MVVGGWKYGLGSLKSSEIYNVSEKIWRKGPDLPIGINRADCVPAPTGSKYSCYLVGGNTDDGYSSKVYGLGKDLDFWQEIGDFGKGRHNFVALPLFY